MKNLYQRKLIFSTCSLLLLASIVLHAKDSVLDTMAMELDRSFQALQGQDDPPYFLSYEITQDEVVSISGAFGQVTGSEKSVNRILDVDIRVGDYFVDNTHPVNVPFGGLGDIFDLGLPSVIPVDDPEAFTHCTLVTYRQRVQASGHTAYQRAVNITSTGRKRRPIRRFFANSHGDLRGRNERSYSG